MHIPEHLDPLGYFDLFGIRFLRVIPMAGKSRPMSQIKQLIRLKQQGYAIKAIARCLSVSKNALKTYLFKIGQAKLNMNELLELNGMFEDDPKEKSKRGRPKKSEDQENYENNNE